jgi:hypothetical protein
MLSTLIRKSDIEYIKIRYQIYKRMIIGFYQIKKTLKNQDLHYLFIRQYYFKLLIYFKVCRKIKAYGYFYKNFLVISRPLI